MKLELNQSDREFAKEMFCSYKQKEGSERIANEFAIANLSAVLRILKPSYVAEFGAGIGTITHVVLAHSANVTQLISIETNSFCLSQIAKNIPAELKKKLLVVEDQSKLPSFRKDCNLVIFDGGAISPDEIAFLAEGSVCFIEGNRSKTANAVNKELAKKGLTCSFKNYIQGYNYLKFTWKYFPKLGRKKLKFKFRQPKKGFRVGQVTPVF